VLRRGRCREHVDAWCHCREQGAVNLRLL